MPPKSNPAILFADYSVKNAQQAEECLAHLAPAVFYHCDNRTDALLTVHRKRPSIILIGLHLDGYRMGIPAIAALRKLASGTDPYFENVPVLLGAQKLDKAAMQSAVLAGIEGVFRMPINPERLGRVVGTVLKRPRRFVYEDDYFGPAKPQALPEIDRLRIIAEENEAAADRAERHRAQLAKRPLITPQKQDSKVAAPTETARPKADLAAEITKEAATLAQAYATASSETQTEEDLTEVDIFAALEQHRAWVNSGGREGSAVSFSHADLRGEDLEGIDLTRSSLPHVSLRGARCHKAVMRRCDLRAGDFSGCDLSSANLATSRLGGAKFTDAILSDTVFLGADLSGASFRGMTLTRCDFTSAHLARADFRDADLSTAKGLFAEQIQRARINTNTRLPRNLAGLTSETPSE